MSENRATATLDTDVVRDLWDDDERMSHVARLVKFAASGEIHLVVTRHIRDDVPCSPLAERINDLPALSIKHGGGVFQLGVSALGGLDGLGSGEFDEWWHNRLATREAGEPRLPGRTDYLHLHAHLISGRDVFLTWDKPILRLGPELATAFRLIVMTPEAFLTSLTEGPVA